MAGRTERYGGGNRPLVVVDYAHTPDALENVLRALRELMAAADTRSAGRSRTSTGRLARSGKLVCVFGCGGDRDRGKRPLMGRIASRLADEVIVTSDNPRSEDPRAIIDEIAGGIRGDCTVIEDRKRAIHAASRRRRPGDVVLIAGKGHEQYQEIAGVKHPHSDAAAVREALGERDRMMRLSEAANVAAPAKSPAPMSCSPASAPIPVLCGRAICSSLCAETISTDTDSSTQARSAGAVAAMVDEAAREAPGAIFRCFAFRIPAARSGISPQHWRARFDIPLVALTGSSGKTTVKEMLAAILREAVRRTSPAAHADAVLATRGNLNNDIGMPLTLLELRAEHRYAVIEMGMNHAGEIRAISQLARPDVALVNNAGTAHIEYLGSHEAIARAKGEIFEGLRPGGIAVINADDRFAPLWRELAGGRSVRRIRYWSIAADVTATYELRATESEIVVKTPEAHKRTQRSLRRGCTT